MVLRCRADRWSRCSISGCRWRWPSCRRIWRRWTGCWRIAGLLAPIEAAWEVGALRSGGPTVPMDRFVRLMIVKARSGWGYETLVREVSDSLHLRRFCRIGLWERVPDESTIRKLVRRLGAEVIEEICCAGDRRGDQPAGGPSGGSSSRAARIDSTVVEADIRYPTDLGLAQDAARALAREAARARELAGPRAPRVSDRSRADRGPAAPPQSHVGGPHRPGQADWRCG